MSWKTLEARQETEPRCVPGSPRLAWVSPPHLQPALLSWAALMRRVFALDVLACPRCGARARVIATITQRAVIVPFLRCLGVPSDVPLLHPARPPPQHELDFW